MNAKGNIPVYSLQSFSAPERISQQYQVEVFDAKRHFQVEYPHRHDFFEVLFLQKGSGFHVIDANRYAIEPPCVFFMSPGQAHKLELSHDISGFIYIFTPEFYLLNYNNQNRLIEFPFFYTVHQDNPPMLLKSNADVLFLEQLFLKSISEAEKKHFASLDLLRSLLDTILTFCAHLYPKNDKLMAIGKGHLLVKRFYQLVEQNIQKNLTVNQYADMLAVSANHLTQTIRLLTGKTSNEIIKSKQILEIKRFLVHSSLGVSEIAQLMGFADQSYFSKFFKRETGITPLLYRTSKL
ncbi:MAG TPA: AraC family transcriptional regulator [Prolixibacteraceae bacterium]|nr:AraC family transcriptional regulator [Prolixibacteraceae bacterium]HPR61528.1 AraC family transcriptional regulator [Prolixibacteraceae bacterium]